MNGKKKGLNAFDTMKMLTSLKKEKEWLNEINSQSLQHSLVELDKAFRSFFKHNSDYPSFRSGKSNQYFIIPANFRTKENKLILPKFVDGIPFRDKSGIPEEIKQVVITKDVERYYASVFYESDETP
ncbi:transposase, IS605 OrfB, partial [mine drainage metagenome]